MNEIDAGIFDQAKFFGETTSTKIHLLRKLYLLFFIQFACAAENLHISYLYDDDYVPWIFQHEEVFVVTAVGQIVLLFCVIFFRDSLRTSPINWIIYVIWTTLLGYNMGYLGVWYDDRGAILMICATVCLISLALLVYALTTKYDLTLTGGTLFILASTMLSYEIFIISTDLPFGEMVSIAVAGIIFGYYYIYTTQNIVIRQTFNIELEDPVIASILVHREIILFPVRLFQFVRKALRE